MVLTSPVIRAVKQQLGAEIHYITKSPFREIVAHNPHISKVFTFGKKLSEVERELRAEKYDLVLDLHRNLRSFRLRRKLGVKSLTFDKLNLRKLLAVKFKLTGLLPRKHIVERYFEGIAPSGVGNDEGGLEYYIGNDDKVDTAKLFFKGAEKDFIVLVIGGSYHTKKIPFNKLVQICDRATLPVVLLGGEEDKPVADNLRKLFPHMINGSGQFSINQSASIVSQAAWVITSDTGLMHIAAAYNKRIISAWGNTIPRFGMTPYKPHSENRIL